MCELRARSRSFHVHASHVRARPPGMWCVQQARPPAKLTLSASSATRLRQGCSCLRVASHSSTPRALSSCWTTRATPCHSTRGCCATSSSSTATRTIVYLGIDPKLIYAKVEFDDRKEASGTNNLVWDKCNVCWCVTSLCMQSCRASFFAGRFWVSSRLIACTPACAVFFAPGQSRRSCWRRTPPSSTLSTSASALLTAPRWPSASTRPTWPSLSVPRPPSTTSGANSAYPTRPCLPQASSSTPLADCGVEWRSTHVHARRGVECTRPTHVRALATHPDLLQQSCFVCCTVHVVGRSKYRPVRSGRNVFYNVRARYTSSLIQTPRSPRYFVLCALHVISCLAPVGVARSRPPAAMPDVERLGTPRHVVLCAARCKTGGVCCTSTCTRVRTHGSRTHGSRSRPPALLLLLF